MHVLSPARFGGLESVVRALAEGHAADGLHVHVVPVTDDAEHPFLSGWGEGVCLHPLIVGMRAYREERRRLRRIIRSVAPDIVHTHGYRSDVLDAPVARRLGVPSVSTAHGFTGGDLKNRLYEWLQLKSFRRFDAVIAVSEPLGVRLRSSGIRRERLHVIRNAFAGIPHLLDHVQARRALNIPENVPLFGWVGRISEEKGPDVLIDAFSLLADDAAHAVFIGSGPLENKLRDVAASRGLAHRVHWAGPLPEAAALFSAFDAFVLSSRTEGTPIALLEAMAAGAPIIATRVGGVPDVLSGEEGLLVEPEDPNALAHAMRRVLEDPVDAEARARRARTRLHDRHGAADWLDRYLAVYRAAAAGED